MKQTIVRSLISLALAIGASAGCAHAADPDVGTLPQLNTIQTYTFTAPYSCGGNYEKSALFLSSYSKERGAPDLLFNGACGSKLYIQASTAGDDLSMISDLGSVALESVSSSKALNYARTSGQDNVFMETMPIVPGHTYAVLASKRDIRALWVLHVNELTPEGKMTITYAVRSYSIQDTKAQSPGFSWEKANQ